MIIEAYGSTEKLKEMYEIQSLFVSSDKQGRGYGTALVRTVLDMVSRAFLSVHLWAATADGDRSTE